MRVFETPESIAEAVGQELGSSDWVTITQSAVNEFAILTRDPQWIHVDTDRAQSGPFGGTIAHGHYVLSLIPFLLGQTHSVVGSTMQINYGMNRVRFPRPTMVGSRVRATATLAEASVGADQAHIVVTARVDAENGHKPVCVAETVARYYF